ncbi:MAG: hypothetical protein IPP77_06370 [Bacteroidetes bacterium]|nr:hypothetical protein [Bacteroidota bacterium]
MLRRSRIAVRLAAAQALSIAGYVINAKHGWIVRENQDGTTTKISRYRDKHQLPVKLD